MAHNDEFYIGYLDKAPPGLAALMRRVVIALALGIPAIVGLVAALQRELPDGVFEFGVTREFEGVLYEKPVPTLRVRYSTPNGDPAVSNLLLVGLGKWGLPEVARGHDGKKVRFKGSLIYKQNMTMVEMNDLESFEVLGSPTPKEARHREGASSLCHPLPVRRDSSGIAGPRWEQIPGFERSSPGGTRRGAGGFRRSEGGPNRERRGNPGDPGRPAGAPGRKDPGPSLAVVRGFRRMGELHCSTTNRPRGL